MLNQPITIEMDINAPLETVWERYTKPEWIMQWNHASDDWYSPRAENDLRVGGAFNFRMEAKDGSEGFDFAGTYTDVVPLERLAYTFGDRTAEVRFVQTATGARVTISFEPEQEHSLELQRAGWAAILANFRDCAQA